MKWEWKGRPLAHPLTILRRLAALPFLRISQCLVFIAAMAGWGIDHAKDEWRNMS